MGFFVVLGLLLEIGQFCSTWFAARNWTCFAVLGLVLEIGHLMLEIAFFVVLGLVYRNWTCLALLGLVFEILSFCSPWFGVRNWSFCSAWFGVRNWTCFEVLHYQPTTAEFQLKIIRRIAHPRRPFCAKYSSIPIFAFSGPKLNK